MPEQNTIKLGLADSANVNSTMLYTPQDAFDSLTSCVNASAAVHSSANLLKTFAELSVSTGGYVHLLPELSYMPVLIGSDEKPVYLYQLVEMFEGFLDYDAILAEFPTLTFSQVTAAISFLRKVSQINSRQIDVDELEDELDTGFLDELRQAFHDREEVARVLTHNI